MTSKFICKDCSRAFKSELAVSDHRRSTHLNAAWIALKGKAAPSVQCPRCGSYAKLSNGKYGVKAECCGLWSWNFKPLSDQATHRARIAAHAALDPVWRSRYLSRSECYRILAQAMGFRREDCHIALFCKEQAESVVDLVRNGIFSDAKQKRIPNEPNDRSAACALSNADGDLV